MDQIVGHTFSTRRATASAARRTIGPDVAGQAQATQTAAQVHTAPFAHFVAQLGAQASRTVDEQSLLQVARPALQQLIATDDWLPAAYAVPSALRYQQYLLHADPQGRFSIVSFVWGPGQATPIHDHTVWGLIGMLRGAERSQAFRWHDDDIDGGGVGNTAARHLVAGETTELHPGDIDVVSPTLGDIHRVSNVYHDKVSVSIHVYGADIGQVERSVYTEDGTQKRFISGYSNGSLPSLL